MLISAETFWAQKAGNDPSEYEDAFWPADRLIGAAGSRFSFALSDGATDACFSGAWARQLVKTYGEGVSDPNSLKDALPQLQRRWREAVLSKRPLPWYVEEKAESGAFATLLGLTLEGAVECPSEGTWRAMAVGDTCLFHVRGRQVLQSFPIEKEEAFNSSPVLLSSKPGHDEIAISNLRMVESNWTAGDSFYLMTDALACWFLKQQKDGRIPWQRLEVVGEKTKRFGLWIDRLRVRKLLRNDDVTLCRIEIQHPHDF